MSEQCHVCGPVKHEAPTVICAPCALTPAGSDAMRRVIEIVSAEARRTLYEMDLESDLVAVADTIAARVADRMFPR